MSEAVIGKQLVLIYSKSRRFVHGSGEYPANAEVERENDAIIKNPSMMDY